MNSFKKTILVTSVLMAGIMNSAYAQTERLGVGNLIEVGQPEEDALNKLPLKGFAKDMPLVTVLKQITPNGWIVKKNDTKDNPLDVKMLVSWSGGSNWVETLRVVAEQNNLEAVVNWKDKTITVKKGVPVAVVKNDKTVPVAVVNTIKEAGVFELEGTPQTVDVVVGASEQVVKAPAPAPVVVPQPQVVQVQQWELVAGKTLKENVKQWAERAGYRLVWLGENYPIDEQRIFVGDFDQEKGPIHQLSIDYGTESRVDRPLSFVFYQNRTLVVENLSYEQKGFPQFSQNK